ncbi:hypothetical protein NUW54_g2384 [Trametes sanguinea]|uniref:Uncharacterized protein n=1 Tax=Trametes sanguinea TaxID=158606 RepID=A0ACC1Q5M0_9APHY|nr:hypothetical protein NUW54_g2384 [Trametes sanguinea]
MSGAILESNINTPSPPNTNSTSHSQLTSNNDSSTMTLATLLLDGPAPEAVEVSMPLSHSRHSLRDRDAEALPPPNARIVCWGST